MAEEIVKCKTLSVRLKLLYQGSGNEKVCACVCSKPAEFHVEYLSLTFASFDLFYFSLDDINQTQPAYVYPQQLLSAVLLRYIELM